MLIDFSKVLLDENNKSIPDSKGEDFTLGKAAVKSLVFDNPEIKLNGQEKYECYKLAKKIESAPELDIPVEEIAVLKKHIGSVYPPLIVGQCFDALEGIK